MQQISWKVEQLIRDAITGVVKKAEWRCTADELDEESVVQGTTNMIGVVALFDADPDAEGFVPFESLTEEVAISWVKEVLTTEVVEQYELQLLSELNLKLNPVEETGTPW